MVSRNLTKALWAILMVLPLGLFANDSELLTTEVNFLSEQITVSYSTDIILDMKACVRVSCIKDFYKGMEQTGYQTLLDDLDKHRKQMQLNDWLYYKLMVTTLEQLYEGKKFQRKKMHFTLTTWFLMSKAGYDTKLTEAALSQAFLYVNSDDEVFNVPILRDNGKRYLNLTAITYNWDTRGTVYRQPKYNPFGDLTQKQFSFELKQLPQMAPDIVKEKIMFKSGTETYTLDIEVDKNIDEIMADYPVMTDDQYLRIPLSQTLSNSLIPQLKDIIAGKSQKETMEILVAFTRSGFTYKWDWDLYEDNRPFVADQVLLNEYSDHEDRTALFIHLVKELTDLPVVAIRYYDYITAAVAIDEEVGMAIDYEGQQYYVCEPTSPSNSNKIGRFPNGMTNKTMEIIASF